MALFQRSGLERYSLFAGMLAMAGLPLYIHAPKFFAETYGISLGTIGLALLGLRILDFIQDPALGWLADNLGPYLGRAVAGFTILLAFAFTGLFAITAPIHPILWFILCIAVLFTSFSFLTIVFYARGISKARELGNLGHIRIAAWRESGALVGICIAALIPSLFTAFGFVKPMTLFAIVFVAFAIGAIKAMSREWTTISQDHKNSFWVLISDPTLKRLLVIGFFNAAPVAVSSSLFLFFVEYRLGSELAAGPILLLFFISAAVSVPFWNRLATMIGAKTVLLWAMLLAICSFSFTAILGLGDAPWFAVICIFSGIALGADMTLLPALFSARVAQLDGANGPAFGLWNFCAKLTLAIAAALVLPFLDWSGFSTLQTNSASALMALTFSYAIIPIALKIIALVVLWLTPLTEI